MENPKLRLIEAFPVEQQNQTFICLRDPMGFAPQPLLIGMGAYFLMTLFDGAHTRKEIQQAFTKRFGETLPTGQLEGLIDALDQAGFLESAAFKALVAKIENDFRVNQSRSALHAGLCYASEPVKLREEIAAYFDPPSGPGRHNGRKSGDAPAGLIAPHIDPRRGGPVYAHAYAELMGRDVPELFIVLGTSHYGAGPQLFTATKKNYETPLGTIETDRDFIDRLGERYTENDLCAEEILHRNEHSIEFQTLLMAWAIGTRGYKVVPILAGSFHEMVNNGTRPLDDPRVAGFVEALKQELRSQEKRACIVAGVDFAHVGRKFGDQHSVDDSIAQWVRSEDHALIEAITKGDPDGFYARIESDGDRRRICGLSPMYTQLALLRGHSGRLLKYDIAMEPQTGSAVSFAALAID